MLVAFNAAGQFYIAGLQIRDLAPVFYQNLPDAKDIHSILAWNERLYIVSTGTDEVLAYDILHNKLGNPQVIWRASLKHKDTHHVNSIVENNGELFISAFGPKSGELWSSALNGYIQNITNDRQVKSGIYHPHSLSARNGQFYYCESYKGTFCSLDNQLLQLSGYARGISWLSDEKVCVTTSIGRKISRSTGLIGNPADPGEPEGNCTLTIKDITNGETSTEMDFSWFGPEIYDVLIFSNQELDLLKLANTSQMSERQAIQSSMKREQTLTRQMAGREQQIQSLTTQVQSLTHRCSR